MKIRKLCIVFTALALLAALAGCAPSKPVSTGSFSGNAYSNDFFGLTFMTPDGWYIASKDDLAALFGVTTEEIGCDDKEAERKLDLSKQKALYLAYTSMHSPDAEESNPNLNLVVENLKLFGVLIRDGKAYAEAALDDLKSTYDGFGMPYEIGDIASETTNGVEYAKVDMKLSGDGFDMYQRVLCTVKNNYALVFTLTWFTDSELTELQKIMDTVDFN